MRIIIGRLRQCRRFEERLWKSSKIFQVSSTMSPSVSKRLQASPVPGRSRESLQPVPAAMAAAVVAVLEPNAPLFAVRTNLRARGGRVNGSKFSLERRWTQGILRSLFPPFISFHTFHWRPLPFHLVIRVSLTMFCSHMFSVRGQGWSQLDPLAILLCLLFPPLVHLA